MVVKHDVEIAWVNMIPLEELPKFDYMWIHDKAGYLITRINGCGIYPIENIHRFEFEDVKVQKFTFSYTRDGRLVADITLDEYSTDVGYDIRERILVHANDTVAIRRTLVIKRRRK